MENLESQYDDFSVCKKTVKIRKIYVESPYHKSFKKIGCVLTFKKKYQCLTTWPCIC